MCRVESGSRPEDPAFGSGRRVESLEDFQVSELEIHAGQEAEGLSVFRGPLESRQLPKAAGPCVGDGHAPQLRVGEKRSPKL